MIVPTTQCIVPATHCSPRTQVGSDMARWYLPLLVPSLALLGLAPLAGCGSPAAAFVRYDTYARKVEKDTGDDAYRLKGSQLAEIDELLTAAFGTPDEPSVPAVEGAEMLDQAKLTMAGGPVTRLRMTASL